MVKASGCDAKPLKSSEQGCEGTTSTSLILLTAGWKFNPKEVRTEPGRPVRGYCNTPRERVGGGFQITEP